MATITTASGTYLIRGPHTVADLRRLYASYCARYGDKLTFERWMLERGKAYFRIRRNDQGR